MAEVEALGAQLDAMSRRLQEVISKTLQTAVAEPPRLVRANSAFDLAKAIDKLRANPDFAAFAAGK